MIALIILGIFSFIYSSRACNCYVSFEDSFNEKVEERVISPLPHSYLTQGDLPANFDWRKVNGTNYCSRVLNQQSPNVCGICWAEATTGTFFKYFVLDWKELLWNSGTVSVEIICIIF